MNRMNFKLICIVIAIFIGSNHICAQNQFTKQVDSELTAFEKKSDSKFLKVDYDIIKENISFFYSQNMIESKDNLNFNRRLFGAYVTKFLNRSFSEFNGSTWNVDTLKFICSEVTRLRAEGKKKNLFEDNSESGRRMKQIDKIFKDYDKINRFVASSKKFSFNNLALNDSFPILDVENLLNDRDKFLKSSSYPYTTKCARLNNDLKDVTKTLFNVHVKYLESKLDKHSECFKETQTDEDGVVTELYGSQPVYRELYYDEMKSQIKELKTKTAQDYYLYKGCNVAKEYDRLVKKLDEQSEKAYEYFESKTANE